MRVMKPYKRNSLVNIPDEVDDKILSEEWAQYIHSQTLKRLNERGGLDVLELIMNLKRMRLNELIDKYGYNYELQQKDVDELISLINAAELKSVSSR